HAQQQASQRKAMTERALEDAKKQAETDEARMADLEAKIAELAEGAEEQQSLIAAASERLADAERQLEASATERAGVLEQLAEKKAALAERRAAAANIDRERTGLLASVAADEKREESIREQAKKVEQRTAAVTQDRERVSGARESLRGTLDERRA